MQKKLIALAVAGLASSAAFAQSNVTVYGIADVYFGHASFDGLNSQNSIGSGGLSSSRLGFKGVEDLGNGLKALFTLEYALAVDSNKGVGSGSGTDPIDGTTFGLNKNTNTARQQFVGLTGGFGTVVAGRLQTAGYDFSAATNIFHGTAINPLLSAQKNLSATLKDTELGGSLLSANSRASNAFAYISPDFSGFKVAFNHARLTENTNPAGATGVAPTLSGNDVYANVVRGWYDNGPLHLDVIYDKISVDILNTYAPGQDDQISEWALGASYDFGVVKLAGSYQSTKDGFSNRSAINPATGALTGTYTDDKNKAWQISAAIPVSSAGKVLVGYAKSTINTLDSADTKSYTLAYTHSLSKRTTLYTGVQHVTNDDNAVVLPATLSSTGANYKTGTPVSGYAEAGGSGNVFVAGINHAF